MHLRDAAKIVAQLLPPGNVVSLQEWVECRMPGEVELGTDDAGLVVLRPGRNSKDKDPDPVLKSFLNRLPTETFLQEEEDLREAIVAVIEKAPETLAQVKRTPNVMKVTKVLLPVAIQLEDWIEHRIGAEVAVESDSSGQRVCRLMGSEPLSHGGRQETRNIQKDKTQEFIQMLPKDSFLPEEEKLRIAIFDFLASWSAQELATLQHCSQHPVVADAKRALFKSEAVNFKDWIEKRIGGELILQPDRHGRELEIHLTPAARPVVAERVALLHKHPPAWRPPLPHSAPPHVPVPMPHVMAPAPINERDQRQAPRQRPERRDRRQEKRDKEHKEPKEPANEPQAHSKQQAFFGELPADELLDKELELRQILMEQMDAYFEKDPTGEGPALSMIASKVKAYQAIKSSLLKNSVSLKDWIDRRIGGEVATKLARNGQVVIYPRNGEGEDGEVGGGGEAIDESMEASEVPDVNAQGFFDGLPPDGFLRSEEELREAILNFLDAWQETQPPTIKQLERTPQIRELMKLVFSSAHGSVSLKMWIDRRIGGEIHTWRKDGRSREVYFGLRLDHGDEADANDVEVVAEASSTKKRKVEEGDGAPNFGKGKGR